MKRRFGESNKLPIESWFDRLQELYFEVSRDGSGASNKIQQSRLMQLSNFLSSTKSFVEIFNGLDKDGDGFITEEEFSTLIDKKKVQSSLTKEDMGELFRFGDRLKNDRLNLFEFMSMLRKVVRVGIEEIIYGYLPFAWASLTA